MVEVRCPTHRQASMLHAAPGELVSLREAEFAAAADVLDVTTTMLKDHAGGDLGDLPGAMLATEVVAATVASDADGFWVFDTGRHERPR
jgi:LmbE family N-acetylglucosaminyl deacetylase